MNSSKQDPWEKEALDVYQHYMQFQSVIDYLPKATQVKYKKTLDWVLESIEQNHEDEIGYAQHLLTND
jgi:hypothetical protein